MGSEKVIKMKNKKQLRIDRAYTIVSNKNPEVTDPAVLEYLTRNYLRRQKLIKVSLLLLLAIAVALAGTKLENASQPVLASVSHLFRIVGPILVLVSIFKFSRIFQDPLTPNEAKELESANKAEKNVDTNSDLPKHKKRRRISYEEQKYNDASPLGKLLILLQRIPFSVYIVIFMLSLFGTMFTAQGILNIATYQERNKNAVEVTATNHRVETRIDRDSKWRYNVYWRYTYNGSYYTHKESTNSSARTKTDTDTLLIDSVHPEIVIINDSDSTLLYGGTLLAVVLFILVFSLKKVRKIDNDYSFYHLIWMIPAFFTVFLAKELITVIMDGYPLVIVILFAIFIPVLFFITWFFYKLLNHDPEEGDPDAE
jgi:hypothetical protein